MLNRSRLLLAALTAALALTLGTATANAARSFSTTSNTLLTYLSPGLTFAGEEIDIICQVTLTASVHATAAKVRGTLMGFVNGARIDACASSLGVSPLAIPHVSHRHPWHVTGNGFKGTLPRITEAEYTINNVAYLVSVIEPFGRRMGCLYRGERIAVETAGRTGAAEYTVERHMSVAGNRLTLFEERLNASLAACPPSGTFIGTFYSTLPVVVRLI